MAHFNLEFLRQRIDDHQIIEAYKYVESGQKTGNAVISGINGDVLH